jgi:tRNA nucleotidyltransferase (CCA-adding enzyme)
MTRASDPQAKDAVIHASWEHFSHDADIGIRGFGPTPEKAFEEAALALMHVVTDVDRLRPQQLVEVTCEGDRLKVLLVEWLNALIFEMVTTKMLFSQFVAVIDDGKLKAKAWGEPIDFLRHMLIVEVKGAIDTELKVEPEPGGRWVAQCMVHV